ncbi:MAG: DUF1576 domain-containing protein [Tissierellia bacterium]|nr:DUF1576 domain-containing protein [Tissierellia bacterium]
MTLLFLFALGLMLTSLLFNSPAEIYKGVGIILTSKSNLITDYMALANPGAAFFNAGFISMMSLLLIKRSGAHISGATLAAFFTMTGFAFFGKNLFNSIPITLGTYIYSRLVKARFNTVILSAFYGTGLSPFVSELAFAMGFEPIQGIIVAYISGILIGMVFPLLSSRFLSFHQGYNLYNGGFTAGIIGMFSLGIVRMFGYDISSVDIISTEYNINILIVLIVIFTALLLIGLYQQSWSLREYDKLLKETGRLVTDFTSLYGFGLTLINMAFMGFLATAYVLVTGGSLNGPILGGIFTIVGFSAFGKHPKNTIPIFIGVYLALLLNIYDPNSTSSTLGALFGTTLAPIAGRYGVIPGIITGFMHAGMVTNITYLHGGVNLYNNGFSGGFIAASLAPIFERIEEVINEKKRKV